MNNSTKGKAMFVGMIIAEDGEIEAAIQFDNRQAAQDTMERLILDFFDPTSDRVEVVSIQTENEIRNEWMDTKGDDE